MKKNINCKSNSKIYISHNYIEATLLKDLVKIHN